MADLSNIGASDGTGEAVQAIVSAARTAGTPSTTVGSVLHWPAKFIATSGKKLSDNTIDPTSMFVFEGHLSAGKIIIDAAAPGYTDPGNAVNDIIVVKPTTSFADTVQAKLQVAHNNDGTLKTGAVTSAVIADATIVTGDIAPAAITPPLWTNPYKFFAYRNSAQTLTASTSSKVGFDAESFDTNNNYDTTNTRYIAPVAGFYSFSATVNINANTNKAYYISLYKNGTEYCRGTQAVTNSANTYSFTVSVEAMQLAINDYVEIYAYNGDTGGNALFVGNSPLTTYFSGNLISIT